MSKFQTISKQIYAVFASKSWTDTNIKMLPENYVSGKNNGEFARLSVIPGGRSLNLKSASGILIIDVFVVSGNGPQRSLVVADKLDELFCGKSFTNPQGRLQFSAGTLSKGTPDIDNSSLYRISYSVTFNFFGAL